MVNPRRTSGLKNDETYGLRSETLDLQAQGPDLNDIRVVHVEAVLFRHEAVQAMVVGNEDCRTFFSLIDQRVEEIALPVDELRLLNHEGTDAYFTIQADFVVLGHTGAKDESRKKN